MWLLLSCLLLRSAIMSGFSIACTPPTSVSLPCALTSSSCKPLPNLWLMIPTNKNLPFQHFSRVFRTLVTDNLLWTCNMNSSACALRSQAASDIRIFLRRICMVHPSGVLHTCYLATSPTWAPLDITILYLFCVVIAEPVYNHAKPRHLPFMGSNLPGVCTLVVMCSHLAGTGSRSGGNSSTATCGLLPDDGRLAQSLNNNPTWSHLASIIRWVEKTRKKPVVLSPCGCLLPRQTLSSS